MLLYLSTLMYSAANRARTEPAIGLATPKLSGACAEHIATMTEAVRPGGSSSAASVTPSAARGMRTLASLTTLTTRLPNLPRQSLTPRSKDSSIVIVCLRNAILVLDVVSQLNNMFRKDV